MKSIRMVFLEMNENKWPLLLKKMIATIHRRMEKTSPNDDRLCTTCNSDENKKKSKWASLLYNFMLILNMWVPALENIEKCQKLRLKVSSINDRNPLERY